MLNKPAMINQSQLSQYMQRSIPELSANLCDQKKCKTIHAVINLMLTYTSEKIQSGDTNSIKKAFLVMDQLHRNGDTGIKNAIESIYIYSFSQLLAAEDEQRNMLLSLMPGSLYKLYVKQMLHSNL